MLLLGTALAFGFFGSLHCLGMCAPIAWAVPQNEKKKKVWVANRLAYNSGRMITYSFLGAIAGFFGEMLSMAGVQQGLSVLAGATIIIGALLLNGKLSGNIKIKPLQKLFLNIKVRIGALLKTNNFKSNLSLGLLNGLLPCGLVYMALVAAISMGTFYGGAAYMALFGLGTFPMMLGAAYLGFSFKSNFTSAWLKFVPKLLVLVGLILILRGLNLDIPYVSPKLNSDMPGMICD